MIKKSDRSQLSERMYYYRQTSRDNFQDFIKGVGQEATSTPAPQPEVKTQTNPEPQTKPEADPVNYEKIGFQQRYNILINKDIEGDSQMDMNISSGELFNEWDALLNDVYKYLKKTKSSYEFNIIKNDERRWIKEKEAAVERSRKEFEGGSAAPLASNSTAIEYTKLRCDYLISLID